MKPLFSLFYKSTVEYNFQRVFGSLCFKSTLSSHCPKFHSRARACIFLGYLPGIKGYKLHDIISKSIFISRDIVFHEHFFPFHSIRQDNKLIDDFPDFFLPKSTIDIDPPCLNPPSSPEVKDTSAHDTDIKLSNSYLIPASS